MPDTPITGKDYSLVERTVLDGLGKFLDTAPGTPPVGTYVTEATLLNWIKGKTIVPGYLYQGAWYADSLHTTEITGAAGSLYVELDTNVLYRWDGEDFVEMSDAQLRADILDGTVTAKKAECDASGNTISTTYATKADAANLQAQISRNAQEIENLKQTTKQQEILVSYPDDGNYSSLMPNLVPGNSAGFAEVSGIRNKVRAWNNLTQNGNFADDSVWRTINTSLTVQNNVGKVTLTDVTGSIWQYHHLISGHEYLFVCDIQASNSTMQVRISNAFGGSDVYAQKNTSWQTLVGKWTCNTTQNAQYPRIYANDASVGDYFNVRKIFCRDLTLMFPEGVPATVAECVKLCPSILDYDEYGYRAVQAVVNQVKAKGFNWWNEEWELGDLASSTGTPIPSSSYIRSVDFCECLPALTYYLYSGRNLNCWVYWYDANKNYIGYTSGGLKNTTTVAPINARYFKICCNTTAYANDICLNISGSLNGTYKPWKEPDVLEISPASSGNSAGSVYDTDELNVEVMIDGQKVKKRRETKRVDSVDFSTLDWTIDSGGARVSTFGLASVMKAPSDSDSLGNYLTEKGYTQVPSRTSLSQEGQYAVLPDSGKIVFYYAGTVPSGLFYYELKTPAVTLSDPILDNYVEAEGGGTAETNQTQATKIDNCVDMKYDLIPA